MVNRPLRFTPFVRPMVWGGRRLGEVLGKPLSADEPHGESWDVSDHPLHRSLVACGPWAGRSLRDLMTEERPALLGPAADTHDIFPWLIKFLDARDWLSVQVHPDEEAVRRLWPGEGSKTEAWFVLDASPGSRIYAGLTPGTDEARLRAALGTGKVVDCLHHFEPQPGDCIFLPAGTVHAVGGGVLMAEIQQTSDATFRLFDWNRLDARGQPRPLHIDRALASIHWTQGPVHPIRADGFADSPAKTLSARRQTLVRCRYFHLEYLQTGEPILCGGTGQLQAVIVLQGSGQLVSADGADEISAGQVWLLPAAMPAGSCRPTDTLKMLLATLPLNETQ